MKKSVIFLSFFVLCNAGLLKAQTWQWATKLEGTLGATDSVVIKGVDVDISNNTYVTGYFTGQLNNLAANTSSLQDGFVAKFSASGALLWAHKFGGPASDAGNAISVETYSVNPGFYITGYVQYNDPSAVTFNGSAGNLSMPSVTACVSSATPNNVYLRKGTSSKQAFVAKYDTSGALVWIKPVYAPSCLDAEGLGISASYRHVNGANYERNVYVTGYFEGNTVSFMQTSPCTWITANGNLGGKTGFVAKLVGTNGNTSWVKSMAVNTNGNATSIGKNLTVDAGSNRLFVTGQYQAACGVGGTTLTNVSGNTLGFVASITPSTGVATWVTEISATGGSPNVEARDLSAVDGGSNYVFALGDYSGSNISAGASSSGNGGGRDLYLVSLSKTTGTVSGIKSDGGIDDQYAYGISNGYNSLGNTEISVSGFYTNSINFTGGSSFGFYGATPNDQYMARYDVFLGNLCATHWDAGRNLNSHTLDACDVASNKNGSGSAYLGGLFFNGESPAFSPFPALSTLKPGSGYVAQWVCCSCPLPTYTVNRPAGSATATISFAYAACDNPSSIFNLEWSGPGGAVMPVTWNTPSVVVSGLGIPSYIWVVRNSCTVSAPVNARPSAVGNHDGATGLKFEVYPNPSDRSFDINSNEDGTLEIYSPLGHLIKQKSVSATAKTFVDVSDLANGTYVCRFVSSNQNVITKKIQVLH